jgi:uncharacterized protein YndB with AHSA1/START domain
MTRYRVARSGTIAAPPVRVYAVLADYREHHPRIVPPEHFPRIEVLAGGVGAGTRTRVTMKFLGTSRTFEHVISEPQPGRVLAESDPDGSHATTFTVEPDPGHGPTAGVGSTHLTIATELTARPGISGALERILTSFMLRRIYRKEIARLAEYVARRP